MPLTEKQWTILARDLRRALARSAPDWTASDTHDPGITVLEVLAFALTDLQSWHEPLDETGRLLARTVAERAGALAVQAAGDVGDDCGHGLQRVNYMAGMLLGVGDFRTEQDYTRNRLNRRNRWLYGAGILSGLEVTVEHRPAGSLVVVAPGLAFDPTGNEIFVDQAVALTLPAHGTGLLVVLHYTEQPCRTVPVVATQPLDAPNMQPTRIVETFNVELATVPAAESVVIARLRQLRGRWRVDPAFKAAHARERL